MFDGAFANPIHWIFAIIVLVLVFGANKLGDIGGALGKSVKEFKEASQAESTSHTEASATQPPGSAVAPISSAAAPTSMAFIQPPPVPEYRPGPSSLNGVPKATDLLPRG